MTDGKTVKIYFDEDPTEIYKALGRKKPDYLGRNGGIYPIRLDSSLNELILSSGELNKLLEHDYTIGEMKIMIQSGNPIRFRINTKKGRKRFEKGGERWTANSVKKTINDHKDGKLIVYVTERTEKILERLNKPTSK